MSAENKKTGWIKIHRSIRSWEWYEDANTFRLFIHILTSANHKPNKWKGISVDRGQLITSREHLAVELKLSIQQIRTALSKLVKSKNITIKTTSKYTTLSVCNYDTYQSDEDESNQQPNKPITIKQPASNQQVTTNKNDKNEKNEKKASFSSQVVEVNCREEQRKALFREATGKMNGLRYNKAWGDFTWQCERNSTKRTEARWKEFMLKNAFKYTQK